MFWFRILLFIASFVYSHEGHVHGPGCNHDHHVQEHTAYKEGQQHAVLNEQETVHTGRPTVISTAQHQNHETGDDDSHDGCGHGPHNHDHHDREEGSVSDGHNHNHGGEEGFMMQLWELVKETCPWVMLGLILTGVLQAFPFSTNLIKTHLQPGNSGLLSCAKASFVGLLTPLCSCGALPLAIALLDSGCSLRAVVAFVTASQSAGIDSMLITYGLLGPYAMVARLLGAGILATAAGFATPDSVPRTKNALATTTTTTFGGVYTTAKTTETACCSDDNCEEDKLKEGPAWKRVLFTILTTFEEVVPWVFLGVVVTAICSIYFPASPPEYQNLLSNDNSPSSSSSFVNLLSTIASRALLLIVTLPLQMCEHASVTFAVALQKVGASQGTAFAFLLSAPATNVATLIFLFQRARRSAEWLEGVLAVVRMTASLVLLGVALSFVFDFLNLKLLKIDKRETKWFWNGDLPVWWEPVSLWLAAALVCGVVLKKMIVQKPHVHKD